MGTARFVDLLRRLAATTYDLLLVAGILVLTSFAVIIARGGAPIPAGSPAFQAFLALQTGGFFIGFWSHGGQTPGMRAWNIRVVTQSGAALSTATAARRFAAALLSAACLGLGLAWMLFDPGGRAWHDRMSDTRVVRVTRDAN